MKLSGILLPVVLCASSFLAAGNVCATDMHSAILANPCAGCHGTDGASPGAIPPIDDMDAEDIRKGLMAYKTDQRKGTIMNRIAKGYTDEEIAHIARYFASTQR